MNKTTPIEDMVVTFQIWNPSVRKSPDSYKKSPAEIANEINNILEKHNTKACDIPESLLKYAIIKNDPEMIEVFLEGGYVFLESDKRFGWVP